MGTAVNAKSRTISGTWSAEKAATLKLGIHYESFTC